jgi:hypothetical protein
MGLGLLIQQVGDVLEESCRYARQATLSGFCDFMSANNTNEIFSLLTVCKASWLPPP